MAESQSGGQLHSVSDTPYPQITNGQFGSGYWGSCVEMILRGAPFIDSGFHIDRSYKMHREKSRNRGAQIRGIGEMFPNKAVPARA
jgi:hypothetical protein